MIDLTKYREALQAAAADPTEGVAVTAEDLREMLDISDRVTAEQAAHSIPSTH